MRWRYGLIANYAELVHGHALTVVSVRDFWAIRPDVLPRQPITLPLHYLVIELGATASEEGKHVFDMRLVDEDGNVVIGLDSVVVELKSRRVGYEMSYRALIPVVGLVIPGIGSYVWEVRIDGEKVGEVTFLAAHEETQEAPT